MQITAIILCALVAITQAAEEHHGAGKSHSVNFGLSLIIDAGWYKKQSQLLAAGSSTKAPAKTSSVAAPAKSSSSSKVSKTSSSTKPTAAPVVPAPAAPVTGKSSVVGYASLNGYVVALLLWQTLLMLV